jgi:hypothetical protein
MHEDNKCIGDRVFHATFDNKITSWILESIKSQFLRLYINIQSNQIHFLRQRINNQFQIWWNKRLVPYFHTKDLSKISSRILEYDWKNTSYSSKLWTGGQYDILSQLQVWRLLLECTSIPSFLQQIKYLCWFEHIVLRLWQRGWRLFIWSLERWYRGCNFLCRKNGFNKSLGF